MAANCNCCCKVIDVYGFDPGGGADTKCWKFEDGSALQGLVVDSGVCIQEDHDTGTDTERIEFEGCELMCAGRNPDGFMDPNPLQEATGTPPMGAPSVMWRIWDCREPGPEDPPPQNPCG
jgi:hypothetical protein